MSNVQLGAKKVLQQIQRIARLRKPRGACDKLATRNYKTYLTQEKQNGI